MTDNKTESKLWQSMPTRALVIMALDIVLTAAAYFCALMLRFDFEWSQIPTG